jgi:hypothetical protein
MFVSSRGALGALLLSGLTLIATAAPVQAQTDAGPFEVGPHVSILRLSELDTTDVGVGIDASWHVLPRITIDGTLSFFPGSGDEPALTDQRRLLGLVGVRSGVTRGRVDFYGRGRLGFLNFADVGPVPCIRIFPAPLTCQLADGYTAFAIDFGGGAIVPIDSEGKWRVRLDVGDLVLRYDQEAHRPNGEITEGFYGHNLLFTAGLVWRF